MGQDRNERSFKKGQWVRFDFWELKSAAFHALSADARALLIEFRHRFNGSNNGTIIFSSREMSAALNTTGKDRTIRAQRELQEKGFIKIATLASYDTRKNRLATEFILTHEPVPGPDVKGAVPATKEFMKWKTEGDNFPVKKGPPPNHKNKKNKRKTVPESGQDHTGNGYCEQEAIPETGTDDTESRYSITQIDTSNGTAIGNTYIVTMCEPESAATGAASVPLTACVPVSPQSFSACENASDFNSPEATAEKCPGENSQSEPLTTEDTLDELTVEQVMKETAAAQRTVYQWFNDGLPFKKVGIKRLVSRADLNEWKQKPRRAPVPESLESKLFLTHSRTGNGPEERQAIES